MADQAPASDLARFLDEHGDDLARFFVLLANDLLDAEDLFHTHVQRLAAKPPEALSLPGALRSALALARGQIRSQKRSRYRPVEVGGERTVSSGSVAPLWKGWRQVPFGERSAVALLLGFDLAAADFSSLASRGAGNPLAAAEHGLLLMERELASRRRLSNVPRGGRKGDALRAVLEGSAPAGEAGGTAARIAAELDSGIKHFRVLHGAVLRPSDWRRMRKRALRDVPALGAVLLFDAFATPFGWFSAAALDGVVVGTAFGRRGEEEWLRAAGPSVARSARQDPRALRGPRRELEEYFGGRRRAFTFPYRLVGVTSFRASVLAACAKIPFGAVRSYRRVAEAAGRPGAWRAVGGALGRNPLPVVVPCHRVIAHTGCLGGFSAGPSLKERLLSLEGMGDLFNPVP